MFIKKCTTGKKTQFPGFQEFKKRKKAAKYFLQYFNEILAK